MSPPLLRALFFRRCITSTNTSPAARMTKPMKKMNATGAPVLANGLVWAEVSAPPLESVDGLVPPATSVELVGDVVSAGDGDGDSDDDGSGDAVGDDDGAGDGDDDGAGEEDGAVPLFQCVGSVKMIEPVKVPNSVRRS